MLVVCILVVVVVLICWISFGLCVLFSVEFCGNSVVLMVLLCLCIVLMLNSSGIVGWLLWCFIVVW